MVGGIKAIAAMLLQARLPVTAVVDSKLDLMPTRQVFTG